MGLEWNALGKYTPFVKVLTSVLKYKAQIECNNSYMMVSNDKHNDTCNNITDGIYNLVVRLSLVTTSMSLAPSAFQVV